MRTVAFAVYIVNYEQLWFWISFALQHKAKPFVSVLTVNEYILLTPILASYLVIGTVPVSFAIF